jgi:hypothetical protein
VNLLAHGWVAVLDLSLLDHRVGKEGDFLHRLAIQQVCNGLGRIKAIIDLLFASDLCGLMRCIYHSALGGINYMKRELISHFAQQSCRKPACANKKYDFAPESPPA